jgi:hypothetical protein
VEFPRQAWRGESLNPLVMWQEESVKNLVRPFGEKIPTICLAAQLILGLLLLVVGLFGFGLIVH